MKIWMDDVTPPPTDWTWAKNFSEFEQAFKDSPVTHVSFHNDLDNDQLTAAKWLLDQTIISLFACMPTTTVRGNTLAPHIKEYINSIKCVARALSDVSPRYREATRRKLKVEYSHLL